MSTLPTFDPTSQPGGSPSMELVIGARERDLGGFSVRRVLPAAHRKFVGPFIFFDHMGPLALPPGQGLDVRPHPHIGLATVTYLFDGELMHRDSLGSVREIKPGDVNWMVAGKGIAHSERSSDEARTSGARMHGIQAWVALPVGSEEAEPTFEHCPAARLPTFDLGGAKLAVIAGTAYGATSPVSVSSPTFYVEARLDGGASLDMPPEHDERAAYVVEGSVSCDGQSFAGGQMLVFRRGVPASFVAEAPSRVMLLGGAPVGERHVFWNLVSSSLERIEIAKNDWSEGRFPKVPGDDVEFIPLPAETLRAH